MYGFIGHNKIVFPYESIHHIAIATKCRTTFQSQVLTIIEIEIATVNGEVNKYDRFESHLSCIQQEDTLFTIRQ